MVAVGFLIVAVCVGQLVAERNKMWATRKKIESRKELRGSCLYLEVGHIGSCRCGGRREF